MSVTTYKVVYKASINQAKVMLSTDGTPAGYVSWGTFNRTDGTHTHDSFCVYHHVRQLAYTAGVQNMQKLSIVFDSAVSIPAPAT